jgi:hypothetical protein
VALAFWEEFRFADYCLVSDWSVGRLPDLDIVSRAEMPSSCTTATAMVHGTLRMMSSQSMSSIAPAVARYQVGSKSTRDLGLIQQ